jgi:hypothetical protein
MKRVEEIREAREQRFKALRRQGVKKLHKEDALREIKQGIDLVISPLVRQKNELNQSVSSKVTTKATKSKSSMSD